MVWEKVFSPKNTARHFSVDHDYVLVYARDGELWRPHPLPRTEEMTARYTNPDEDSRGVWTSGDMAARNFYSEGTYPITTPSGREIPGPPPGTYWRVSQTRLKELVADNRVWWGPDGAGVPRLKRFLSEVKQGSTPRTLWRYSEVGHTQDAKKQMLRLVSFESSASVFDTPKPVQLMDRMLDLTTKPTEPALVLDFFAGSGAMGDAVLRKNATDGGLRRFVLVQLPEPQDDAGMPTIAALTRARVAAVASELDTEGFRAYRLTTAALVRPQSAGREDALFVDALDHGREDEALLTELLLARGFDLTEQVARREVAGAQVADVADGALLACFTQEMTSELFEALVELEPAQLILLEAGFGANDEVKVNALQHLKTANAHRQTPIELLVV